MPTSIALIRTMIIAYDSSDDRKRARIAKRLIGFGCRLQQSVFLCQLTPKQKDRLVAKLGRELDDHDRLLVADLGPSAGRADRALQLIGPYELPDLDQVVF